jgi:4-hydroxybenzoate polyprenyltransferase
VGKAKRILEAFVYTNVWVAIAVASLSALTMVVFHQFDFSLIAFTFFATLLMYAYARKFESPGRLSEATSKLTQWADANPLLFWVSAIIGLLGTLFFARFLHANTWIWVAGCAALSAIYPLQFIGNGAGGLRHVAGLKLLVISAVWAIVTVILPAAQTGATLSFEISWLAMQRFLFVMAITIPFDIRDLRIDSPSINTLPYLLGIKRARFIAHFSIFLAEVGAVFMYLTDFFSAGIMAGHLIAFELTSLLIYRSSPKRPDLFFSFWVEGTSVLLFLLVFIFNYFWP